MLLLLSCSKKSLRCLHASPSQQQQYPLSWVCKAAALGLSQFPARLRPLLGMRISFWLPLPIHLPFHYPRSQHGQESIVECSSSPCFQLAPVALPCGFSPQATQRRPELHLPSGNSLPLAVSLGLTTGGGTRETYQKSSSSSSSSLAMMAVARVTTGGGTET
ncbi:hypothetical protein LAZ67_1007350 [Cordylochernes scorpioides]|uniref:Uncharacterized protein n=1 Tax=Cordylochernes scorpioides TaxID=51811 RepID=A0ABY6JZA2_9ARAC|nr:hypothetical protein LAZ67_1007350 [Cordylochernes scorpioides]